MAEWGWGEGRAKTQQGLQVLMTEGYSDPASTSL